MKKTRIFAAIAASAVAASALAVAASAYSFNDKNLGKNWSSSLCPVIPPEEFADVTADTYITITFTPDADETEYWCIKPVINTDGWPFIAIDEYITAGEDIGTEISINGGKNDSFPIADADVTSTTFKVPALAVDDLKEYGMVIQGHSITLHEMTFSNEAPAQPSAPEEPSAPTEPSAPAPGGTDGAGTDPNKDKPAVDTGIEGVAVVAGLALVASAAVVISRKRK